MVLMVRSFIIIFCEETKRDTKKLWMKKFLNKADQPKIMFLNPKQWRQKGQ